MSKCVIVSNKLPLSIDYTEKSGFIVHETIGGLTTGMKSVHSQKDSLWVGWNGSADDDLTNNHKQQLSKHLKDKHACVPVYLSNKDVDGFYYGFCNKTIWPLFHYFTQTAKWSENLWDTYIEGNNKFFEVLKEVLEPEDTVWIHDYQLMLLPELLRKHFPKITIGFFLHIPFP